MKLLLFAICHLLLNRLHPLVFSCFKNILNYLALQPLFLCAYLKKTIPETRRMHSSMHLNFSQWCHLNSVLIVYTENHRPVANHCPTSPGWDSNSQLLWWYAMITQIFVNPTTIRTGQRRPPYMISFNYYNGYLVNCPAILEILQITPRRKTIPRWSVFP